MASLLERFRRPRAADAAEAPVEPRPRGRRPPAPGLLRRERRQLARMREQAIRDLGGLVLEMYRQDRFRQDLVYEHATTIVAMEERLFQIDQMLAASAARGGPAGAAQCAQCGAALFAGARFCPSCGHPVATAP